MRDGDVRGDAHARTPEEVAAALGSDPAAGLAESEARSRLERLGPNELPRPTRPDYARIALRQVADPLVGLLVAAAAVSFAIGEGVESGAIAAIVVLNAAFGFWQEVGAARAVLALTEAVTLKSTAVGRRTPSPPRCSQFRRPTHSGRMACSAGPLSIVSLPSVRETASVGHWLVA